MESERVGMWLIGAHGSVATTVAMGLAALKRRLIGEFGLVSQLPRFRHLSLPRWEELVIGGHEIRAVLPRETAAQLLHEQTTAYPHLLDAIGDELEQIAARVRPGTLHNVGPTIRRLATLPIPPDQSPRATVERLRQDLLAFADVEKLAHVVVVNLASTEPLVAANTLPPRWGELARLLDTTDRCPLPASSLYAIAALEAGCSYINFTPSLGSSPAGIDDLARLRGSRHMGCDGKTGETLLKSVLAPMFAQRNLRVESWVGHNIFGNMDGQVLNDPANKQSKITTKQRLLAEILGYQPGTCVSIEYIEGLGDWKTAWDHVRFRGFLGTPMTLQFIWQGCDSVLAAPLVLDLVRFADLARRRGVTGLMTFLASFFKSPYGVSEHRFEQQFAMLERWADQQPSAK